MQRSEQQITTMNAGLDELAGLGLDRAQYEQLAPESEPTAFQPYNGGRFEVSAAGVYFVKEEKETRIASALRVTAQTCDEHGNGWGRLLEWRDGKGNRHIWAMPMTMLAGDGIEAIRELLSRGLTIAAGQNRALINYLQTWKTHASRTSVSRLGWHGKVYCLPGETIGGAGGAVVYQSEQAAGHGFTRQGNAEEWRNEVASLAGGNSRLTFAICCAFAGPLLHLAGVESGGFHFVAGSSTGKTTALKVAASVWGHPERYTRTWRATANGLEGIAAAHNDGLLILDELGQCDGKQAGEAAYMLANGKGKARASRSGGARDSASWRVLFLSSGEVKLATHMQADRRKVNAGQELRLANIPMDAGKGLGGFEQLHGSESPGLFAQRIARVGETLHGSAGLEWLHRLTSDLDAVPKLVSAYVAQFVSLASPSDASGQVGRVARRFGLVAAAGELATEYGLTGWQEQEAQDAALACFRAWHEDFGHGSHEERAISEQVRFFLSSTARTASNALTIKGLNGCLTVQDIGGTRRSRTSLASTSFQRPHSKRK
jgi:uncharacterized protein (DUF927 family)